MEEIVEKNNSIEWLPQMPRLKPLNTYHNAENILNVCNIDVEPKEVFQDTSLLNSQDILHMDIIFDNNTDVENGKISSAIAQSEKAAPTKNLSNNIVNMEIDYDCGNAANAAEEKNLCDSERTDPLVIKNNIIANGEDCKEDVISEIHVKPDMNHEESYPNSIDFTDCNLSSLVVVAREDPLDTTNVIHEVFLMSPDTGILSDEPLELPPEIIERIKNSLFEGSLCNE